MKLPGENIGNLNNLKTEEKSNLVNAINELTNTATANKNGLMSSEDKMKLNNILKDYGAWGFADFNDLPDGIHIINGWNSQILNRPSEGWILVFQTTQNDRKVQFTIIRGTNDRVTKVLCREKSDQTSPWTKWT